MFQRLVAVAGVCLGVAGFVAGCTVKVSSHGRRVSIPPLHAAPPPVRIPSQRTAGAVQTPAVPVLPTGTATVIAPGQVPPPIIAPER